jgi:alpha-beta hydrolase superfamily lysophospholipase
MRNVIFFHGSDKPDWSADAKEFLQDEEYSVVEISNKDSYAMMDLRINEETIMIGLSSGCSLLLESLEKSDRKINRAMLIEPSTDKKYNWKKIREKAEEFILFSSDHEAGIDIVNNLHGVLIILHKKDKAENAGRKEFPIIKRFLT